MPTLRQRFMGLAGHEREERWWYRQAWKWARERLADHIVHVEGQSVRLFPGGGLDAAASYTEVELKVFAGWLVLAQLSYDAFY